MAKICNNPDCGHFGEEQNGKFCPYCGSPLQEKPADGASVNLRGSTVTGGMSVDSHNDQSSNSHNVHTTDSHNVQTVDSHNQSIVNNSSTSDSHDQSIVHNTHDSNNVVNSHNVINTTSNNYHVHQKTDTEISQENLKRFRQICSDNISAKGLYSNDALKVIMAAQNDLRINDATAASIKNEVMRQVKLRSEAALTISESLALEEVKEKINSNRAKRDFEAYLTKLEGMTERTSVEDAHYYYNFLLAALAPAKLKENYLNRIALGNPDEYWQTFWASYAFMRDGDTRRFEEGKSQLSGWEDKPEQNILLLDATEKAVAYFKDQSQTDALDRAKVLVRKVLPHVSGYLGEFASNLSGILEGKTSVTVTRNFYTCNFFPDFRFNSYQGQSPLPNPTLTSTASSVPRTQPSAPVKKKSNTGLIVGIAAACLVVGFLVFKPSGKDQEAAPVPVKQEQPAEVQKAAPAAVESAPAAAPATKANDTPKQAAGTSTQPATKPATSTTTTPAAAPKTSGSYSLPYGTYNGPLASGKPNGEGKVTITKAFTLDNKSGKTFNLEPGDYLDAEFKNGQLMNAYWYGPDGKKKGSIVIAQ